MPAATSDKAMLWVTCLLHLDSLQGFFFLLCSIRQVHYAFLDALDSPIECEAVIGVQLIPRD